MFLSPFFHFFFPSWWRAIAATAAIAICCKSEAVIISSCPRAAAKVATVPVKPRNASVCCVNDFLGSCSDTNKKRLLLVRAWYATTQVPIVNPSIFHQKRFVVRSWHVYHETVSIKHKKLLSEVFAMRVSMSVIFFACWLDFSITSSIPNYSAGSLNHRIISSQEIFQQGGLWINVGDEHYLLRSVRWIMNSPPHNEDPSHGTFFWRLMFPFLGWEPLVNHPPASTIPRKYSQSCSCQEHQIPPKPHLPFTSFCCSFSPPIQIQETSSSRRDKTSSQFPNCFAALMAELKVIKFACKDLSRMLYGTSVLSSLINTEMMKRTLTTTKGFVWGLQPFGNFHCVHLKIPGTNLACTSGEFSFEMSSLNITKGWVPSF